MKIISPAKINLMLRILSRFENGYHELQTYFLLLNWGDQIHFTPDELGKISIQGNFNGLPVEENLIFKALELLKPFQLNRKGMNILVQKNIPQGSGLGGGSSNAATTLIYANNYWNCGLSYKKLSQIGVNLGADVPIFIQNTSAMAEGIGEKINPYSVGKLWIVLIFPDVSVSTADVFAFPSLKRNNSKISVEQIVHKKNWTNDCTQAVLEHYPKVKDCFDFVSRYSKVYMSGTGSTLFAIYSDQKRAETLIKKLSNRYQTQLCESY